MKILSYNTLFGGFDGAGRERHEAIIATINQVCPDIVLAQELKGFDVNGGNLLFEFERATGLRGFIAPAPQTGQHTGVFIRSPIAPVSFDMDAVHFHHAAAVLTVRVPEFSRPITFISLHLCPLGGHVRLREISYLMNYADPKNLVLLGGDFNSVSPDDAEPLGFETLPAHFQARYLGDDGRADRRSIANLLRFGFVDIAMHLQRNADTTVPTTGFPHAEFVPFRSDYFMASKALAELVTDYAVLKTAQTDFASDHYPIVVEFLNS